MVHSLHPAALIRVAGLALSFPGSPEGRRSATQPSGLLQRPPHCTAEKMGRGLPARFPLLTSWCAPKVLLSVKDTLEIMCKPSSRDEFLNSDDNTLGDSQRT